MFVYYAGFMILAQLVLVLLYYNLPVEIDMKAVKDDALVQFFRTIIYFAIWASFVRKSERVKLTFVNPHH